MQPQSKTKHGPVHLSVPGPYVLRARMERVRDRNILFSLQQHGIFELNDTSADIWTALAEQQTPAAIISEMVRLGVPEEAAGAHVASALDQWTRLGLLHPAFRPPSASEPFETRQMLEIAGLPIAIDYGNDIEPSVRAIFRHLEVQDRTPSAHLRVQTDGAHIHLFRDGEWNLSCTKNELPTMLKGALVSDVLHGVAYEIALHAAALVRDDRLMLLLGRPGAGKTTLTLALLRAGFGFAGDDVTLLDDRGRATGLPFAPAVKSGAWRLLDAFLPELRAAPVYRRPDGKKVRYPVPEALPAISAREVGWIVLLDRGHGTPRLDAVDPASALRGLLDGAYAASKNLSDAGVDVLVQVLRSTPVHRLSYRHLDDAVRILSELVDDARP